jgi:hypothetical protein
MNVEAQVPEARNVNAQDEVLGLKDKKHPKSRRGRHPYAYPNTYRGS